MLDWASIPANVIITLHRFSFVALFIWFMCLAAMGIDSINQQVQTVIPAPHENLSAHIKKWRQDYGYVYRFTEEINRSFSHYLVLSMAFFFILYSFYPYKLHTEWDTNFSYNILDLWKTVSRLPILLSMVYMPITLRNKVNMFDKDLASFFYDNCFFNSQNCYRSPIWSATWASDISTMATTNQKYGSNIRSLNQFQVTIFPIHNRSTVWYSQLVKIYPQYLR